MLELLAVEEMSICVIVYDRTDWNLLRCFQLIHQFLDGHHTAVSDIVDIGRELQSVGSDCDCAPAMQLVNDITDKYEAVKQSLKEKSMAQEEAFKRSFTDVGSFIVSVEFVLIRSINKSEIFQSCITSWLNCF